MEKIRFVTVIQTILRGHLLLMRWCWQETCEAFKDLWNYTIRHFILVTLLVLAYGSMFFAMSYARIERDAMAQQAYIYEHKADSLETIYKR